MFWRFGVEGGEKRERRVRNRGGREERERKDLERGEIRGSSV
jgi:hypothetical protein